MNIIVQYDTILKKYWEVFGMKLTRIRYFIEVAKCANFTEAASRLFTSQPNLSKQIAILENEIGTELFFRAKRQVELTPAGKLLFEQLNGVPDMIDSAIEQAAALGRMEKGELTIGVLERQDVSSVIMPKLSGFSKLYPNTKINLERNSFKQLRHGLQNGHFDLIITLLFDVEGVAGLSNAVILKQRGAIVAHQSHPISWQSCVSLAELQNEAFILISSDETQNGTLSFFRECASFGFTPRLVCRPSSLESLLLCVEAGMGIALLDQNIRLDSDSPLRVIPIIDISSVEFAAVWNSGNKNTKVSQLISALKLE